jgi:hypothetical protein
MFHVTKLLHVRQLVSDFGTTPYRTVEHSRSAHAHLQRRWSCFVVHESYKKDRTCSSVQPFLADLWSLPLLALATDRVKLVHG